MKETMKTEQLVAAAAAYEPPRMTVVPLRASASLLTGSVGVMSGTAALEANKWDFANSSNSVATEWSTLEGSGESNQGWGSSFFDAE